MTLASPDAIARMAAESISTLVTQQPGCVLGLPTGSTPIATYAKLVESHNAGLSFADVATFNLDEYVGLPDKHEQSYHHFMATQLFDHIDIDTDRTHLPDGMADDLDTECQAYENDIANTGGLDLCVLGIGTNGHIAFNEPGCALDSRTRVVGLSPETISTNSRLFDSPDDVPREAISAGIATILDAKRLLLLAYGGSKAEAVAQALAGPVTSDCPASYLQNHPDCTFLLDTESASLLTA
jgi:glucosamine-6-phosphate deaminase